MGANVYPGGTTFRVWAPNASAVSVAFGKEGWQKTNHPMAQEPGNAEYTAIEEAPGAYVRAKAS